MNKFIQGYMECILWAETDESNEHGGEPLENNYDFDSFSEEAIERIKNDCNKFLEQAENMVLHLLDDYCLDHLGHDFWLTRVGHGAGFWDGDYPDDIGEKLTQLSESFGHVNIYVGDDNKLYFA